MIKVYKSHDFMLEFDNIYSAWEYIERNGYKVYTTYCGGTDITVIEVY